MSLILFENYSSLYHSNLYINLLSLISIVLLAEIITLCNFSVNILDIFTLFSQFYMGYILLLS